VNEEAETEAIVTIATGAATKIRNFDLIDMMPFRKC
jgi:hypothetical protein